MKKVSLIGMTVVLMAMLVLTGCSSQDGAAKKNTPSETAQAQPQQKAENQFEKFKLLYAADGEKLVVGSDDKTTIESIEAAFQPKTINSIDEITPVLTEPGRPYYFKLHALYKGYDKTAKQVQLQDLGKQSNTLDAVQGAIFGVDSSVSFVDILHAEVIIPTLPTEANSIADFYLVAGRFTEGKYSGQKPIYIRFVRNIQKPVFESDKFIVASGMHYITTADTKVQTQQDVMMNVFTGGAMGNSSATVFDPVVYPLVDLMDARVAMDKKDIRNGYTFPTVRIKYVSEAVFKGQTNTSISVSTDDNVLTERMTFTGRASTVKNGDKIRVYYTIAKDPLEKWEVQAIERR